MILRRFLTISAAIFDAFAMIYVDFEAIFDDSANTMIVYSDL